MTNKVPKSVSSKVFTIYGIQIQCHLLDDGRRVIASDSLSKLLVAMANDIPDLDLEAHDLDHFVMWCKAGN